MKKALILFLVSCLLPLSLWSAMPEKAQLLSPPDTLEVLKELKPHAIVFGEGESEIHTFIDPYCEMSQRYLAFVFEQQERMFPKYKFYFYLYELNGKNSSHIITSILSSEFKDVALKSVMLNHEDIPFEDNGEAQRTVHAIAQTAIKIGVFKRPYIIINGKVKQ